MTDDGVNKKVGGTFDKGNMIGEKKETLKQKYEHAKKEIKDFGGWKGFKSGEWLISLIRKSFRNYYDSADPEFFREKYHSKDNDFIAQKLTTVASKNASLLGVVVGATVSADELLAILTAGEFGVGLPANVALAFTAVAAETILLTRMQLHLVASLAKLYGVPLNPDDPEDILTIFAFATGGAAAEAAGAAGMKIGAKITERLIRQNIKKEVLKSIQKAGKAIGIKILQRTIIKYSVPGISMGIGGVWNYASTKAIGKIAKKHFNARAKEMAVNG